MEFESLNKKPNSKELIQIYVDLKGDDEYSEYALIYYEATFKDFQSDGDYNNDDLLSLHEHILFHCLRIYLPYFLKIIRKGHSGEWADGIFNEKWNDGDPTIRTYYNFTKENPELAWREITHHCKSLSKDEVFQNYYLYMIENEFEADNIEERAFKYCEHYHNQINRGNSEIYADNFAKSIVRGFNQSFSNAFAFSYERLLKKNISETYADSFSDLFGEFVVGGCLQTNSNLRDGITIEQLEEELKHYKLFNKKTK